MLKKALFYLWALFIFCSGIYIFEGLILNPSSEFCLGDPFWYGVDGPTTNRRKMVYQEDANEFSHDSLWGYSQHLNDSNWSTYGAPVVINYNWIWINYTIPYYALEADWQIKHDDPSIEANYSILDSCFNYNSDKLMLRVKDDRDGGIIGNITFYCYNGSWVELFNSVGNYDYIFYEEGMWWKGFPVVELGAQINITARPTIPEGYYTGSHFNTQSTPLGITNNETFFWMNSYFTDTVYKFTLAGTYTEESFDLSASGNADAWGITNNNTFFWANDYLDDRVYKYYLNGTYINYFSISGSGNNDPKGMTNNNTFFWIVDNVDLRVYKYTLGGTYVSNFDTSPENDHPAGITTNNTFIWITDSFTNNVHKYYMNGTYVGEYFDMNEIVYGAGRGITMNNDFFWGVDYGATEVYKYYKEYTGPICVDIDHPDYGDNYTCDSTEVNFLFNISYFRKNMFNDSTTSKILEYVGNQIKTIFFSAHQYDEVDNMEFNISGVGLPENVQINKSNLTEVDRMFPGFLIGSNIYVNKTIFGDGNESVFFQNPGSKFVNFYMDDGANLISFIFNISGLEFGLEYFDDFDDEAILDGIQNEGMFRGSFGLPQGNNLKSFVYDSFSTAANLVSGLWTSYANGEYYVCGSTISSGHCDVGDEYHLIVNNHYTGNEMVLRTEFSEATSGGNSVTSWVNSPAYVNYSLFNIWTTQEIDLELSYDIDAFEDDSREECIAYSRGYLGNVLFWQSPWQQCEDSGTSNCNEGSRTKENLIFKLKRNINNSWNVSISGSEEAYGDDIDDGDCGWYKYIYNYTNNSLSKTYRYPGGSCGYSNSMEFLANEIFINDLSIGSQFKLIQYMRGKYDDGDSDGCGDIDSQINIKVLNYSLFNLTNSSLVSKSIYDSSGTISKATMNVSSFDYALPLDNLIYYLSADGGVNWETVSNGVEHTFTDQGKDLRYRIDFNLTEEGYLNCTIFLKNLTVAVPKGYPTNISFDFGNDGIIDANFSGELNSSNSPYTINISTADLTSALNASPILFDHLMSVPLEITSDTIGQINLTSFNLTYNPNPISLNITSIWNFLKNSLNFVNFSISIESINGNTTVDDVKYDYAGGESIVEIFTYMNENKSFNDTLELINYYSRWDYEWIPKYIEWIYFAPRNSTDKNVQPYGQTSSTPIINITSYAYGGENSILSIYQNGTNSCVNTTLSLDNNKSNGFLIGESWTDLTNMSYLETVNISLWADYDCSYDNWHMYEPQYYYRLCVEEGACSDYID